MDPVSTYYIFTTYDSTRGITLMDELREMILDRVTLKQGKTHCREGLIMDPIAHVVTDVVADLLTKLAVCRIIT